MLILKNVYKTIQYQQITAQLWFKKWAKRVPEEEEQRNNLQ